MISKKRRRIPVRLALFLFLAFCLLLLGLLAGSFLRGGVFAVFVPLVKSERAAVAWIGGLAEGFRKSERLAEENVRLQEALAQSEITVLDRNRLYEENLELKERLGRIAEPNAITAAVLLAPPRTPYDTLLLDAGARDGVSQGDKVAAGGTVLVGEIREVYARSSRAVLFSAPGESLEGHLAAQGLAVSVEGQGGGALRGRTPQGVVVARGDELSLPGVSGGVLGFVEHAENVEGESFQTVYFRLPVNPLTLQYVDIWRQK